MDTPDLKQPESIKHMAGSSRADIILGIVTGLLWWGLGGVIVSFSREGLSAFAIILAFIVQVIVVRSRCRCSGRFIIWQLLTVVLAPVLAFGLLFGACIFGNRTRL